MGVDLVGLTQCSVVLAKMHPALWVILCIASNFYGGRYTSMIAYDMYVRQPCNPSSENT